MVEKYDITLKSGFSGAKRRIGQKTKDPDSAWYYLAVVGQIGYVVALPIAGGAILGSVIDQKSGSYPKGAMTGIVIGFIVSIFGFIGVIRKILEKKN